MGQCVASSNSYLSGRCIQIASILDWIQKVLNLLHLSLNIVSIFASNAGRACAHMFYRRFAAMEFGPRGRLVAGRFGGSPRL